MIVKARPVPVKGLFSRIEGHNIVTIFYSVRSPWAKSFVSGRQVKAVKNRLQALSFRVNLLNDWLAPATGGPIKTHLHADSILSFVTMLRNVYSALEFLTHYPKVIYLTLYRPIIIGLNTIIKYFREPFLMLNYKIRSCPCKQTFSTRPLSVYIWVVLC